MEDTLDKVMIAIIARTFTATINISFYYVSGQNVWFVFYGTTL